jgi:hypothetical protein
VTPNVAYPQIFADLDQNDPHPRPAHNSNSAEQMQALRKKRHRATLDEMLREPAIRLIMRRDNVTEDQLLYLINMACRHINR